MTDIIIPTYRPGAEFAKVLKRLEVQTLCPGKIIIMNTERRYFDPFRKMTGLFTDSAPDVNGEERIPFGRTTVVIRHIGKESFDHGATRDQAIRLSDADTVVLMTQDAVPANRHLLEILTSPIREQKAAASYARQLPKKHAGKLESRIRQFNYPENSLIKTGADLKRLGIKTFFLSNACAAYDRDIYLRLGGFTQKTIFNEDMVFAAALIDAGYAIAYEGKARVFHSHRYTLKEQLRRNFDIGVSQQDHPEVFRRVPSEGEGMRMVKKLGKEFLAEHDLIALMELGSTSAAKYLGYQLGRHYEKLPESVVRRLTMNSTYWER